MTPWVIITVKCKMNKDYIVCNLSETLEELTRIVHDITTQDDYEEDEDEEEEDDDVVVVDDDEDEDDEDSDSVKKLMVRESRMIH